MERETAREIIECLPKGRTLFYYFRGRYALMLLSYAVGSGASVRQLRRSKYAKLLDKPLVRDVLSGCPDGVLTAEVLQSVWSKASECYLLTLDTWSGDGGRYAGWLYDQTSRRGANLVVQLNFSNRHNRVYDRLIRPGPEDPFVSWGHPVAHDGHHTLAWSRIDLDFHTGEALIEEIQSDWGKLALERRDALAAVERYGSQRSRWLQWQVRNLNCDLQALSKYIDSALRPHLRMWSEVMLAATIWFLREELGLRRIFYHTFETGAKLKGITHRKPPKSLYSTLPCRFLFEETTEIPAFLHHSKRRRVRRTLDESARFYILQL